MESPTTECQIRISGFGTWWSVIAHLDVIFQFFFLGLLVPKQFHVHIFIDLFDCESPTTDYRVLKPETRYSFLLDLLVPKTFHVHIFIDLFDHESPTTDHRVPDFGFWHSVVLITLFVNS
jgi:hypothetical protein